jgi:hypothetical protein
LEAWKNVFFYNGRFYLLILTYVTGITALFLLQFSMKIPDFVKKIDRFVKKIDKKGPFYASKSGISPADR